MFDPSVLEHWKPEFGKLSKIELKRCSFLILNDKFPSLSKKAEIYGSLPSLMSEPYIEYRKFKDILTASRKYLGNDYDNTGVYLTDEKTVWSIIKNLDFQSRLIIAFEKQEQLAGMLSLFIDNDAPYENIFGSKLVTDSGFEMFNRDRGIMNKRCSSILLDKTTSVYEKAQNLIENNLEFLCEL